ncbi:hypothetical protein CCACVL1_01399, partial [Corchorus capsularis]
DWAALLGKGGPGGTNPLLDEVVKSTALD